MLEGRVGLSLPFTSHHSGTSGDMGEGGLAPFPPAAAGARPGTTPLLGSEGELRWPWWCGHWQAIRRTSQAQI